MFLFCFLFLFSLRNFPSYLLAEQTPSSIEITNIHGNFYKQYSFFCSIDAKKIASTLGTAQFNKTNVNNMLSTGDTTVIRKYKFLFLSNPITLLHHSPSKFCF